MTKEERLLLQSLDETVRSQKVRTRIERTIGRVRDELSQKPEALMTWEPIPLETFGDQLPPSIRSAWIFVLRAGADTGAERHPNSHQRMMTYQGTGDMKIDIKSAKNDVERETEIQWRSNILISDGDAPLEQRWISIPRNIWHRPVIPKGAEWVVVSFHTVPASELIEERPGAKQMFYQGESEPSN
jgi:hypothetical protein